MRRLYERINQIRYSLTVYQKLYAINEKWVQ